MKPSDGSIQLDNRDGEFNIMNPNTRYSISPGTKVRIITVIGGLQYTVFEGWLKSAVSTVNSQGIDATVLLIHSTLGYIANYDEGLFSLVAGRIRTTSQIFSAVIDTLASLNVHITVSIDPSNIRVFSQRINSTGAFGSGRNHASIMDAFRLLAQIEGGRIYDDEQGVLHFEGYNRRYTTNATVKRITATDNRNVVTHSLDDYIVNNIQSEANVLVAQNYKDLEFDRDFDEEINIPPGNWSITYTVSDPEVVLVENWETLSTKHYHYSITNLPNLVKASYQDKSIIFNIQNPTDAVATFRLHSMRGQPFIKGLDTTLHLRSEDSIRRYGTKSAEYPISLVDNQDLMRGYLQAYLDDFDGIGINGEADPIKSISVTVRNPDTIYKISDLVLLDWKTPWNINTNAHPFWVEAVDYSLDSEGNMDVTVALLDAWRGVLRKGGEVGSISLLPAIIEHEIGYIGLDLSTVEQTIDFIDLLPAIVDEAEIGYIEFVAPVEDTIGYIDIVSEGEIGFVLLPPPSEQSIGFVDLDTPLPQESEIGFIDIPEPDNKTEYMVGYIDLYEEHLESEIDFVELPIPTPTESTIGFVELPKPSETEIGSFALAKYVPPEAEIGNIVLETEKEVGSLGLYLANPTIHVGQREPIQGTLSFARLKASDFPNNLLGDLVLSYGDYLVKAEVDLHGYDTKVLYALTYEKKAGVISLEHTIENVTIYSYDTWFTAEDTHIDNMRGISGGNFLYQYGYLNYNPNHFFINDIGAVVYYTTPLFVQGGTIDSIDWGKKLCLGRSI